MENIHLPIVKLSHEKNPRRLSIESWLFNRDPYVMVYEIIPTKLGSISSPIHPKQPFVHFLHCSIFHCDV